MTRGKRSGRGVVLFLVVAAGCGGGSGEDAGPRDAASDAASDLGADMPDLADCQDDDSDGHRAASCGGDDCDDADPNRYPGRTEVCDALDDDCDPVTLGPDADGDGVAASGCCNPTGSGTSCGTDCDDTRATVGPTAHESCNGLDDDCDGIADDGVLTPCFADADRDGYAVVGAAVTPMCTCPDGFTAVDPSGAGHADCDDGDSGRNPATTEVCNTIDDDCDGVPDDGVGTDYYADCDGDTYGDTAVHMHSCVTLTAPPPGCPGRSWTTTLGDCNDAVTAVHPGVSDTCNATDDDCDGTIDGAPADMACMTAGLPHAATVACTAGVCTETSCASPYFDCSAAPGCETDGTSYATCGGCSTACRWHGCIYPGIGCDDAVELAAGSHFGCVLRASGAVACWGLNDHGQLGDGTTTNRPTAVAVSGLTDAVELSVGYAHACARRTSGAVSCWGDNARGQIGTGAGTTRYTTPTAVSGLADATQISAGYSHTCAIRATGALQCWGDNLYGELGDGTTTERRSPTTVTAVTDAAEVGAATWGTCVRRTSGAVACWGDGRYGELGDGSVSHSTCSGTDCSLTPVTVSGLADATELAVGKGFTRCALRATGAVVCWGTGQQGQLGDGAGAASHSTCATFECATTPVTVSGISDAVQIDVGAYYACARRPSGAVSCWGGGIYLGDGATTHTGVCGIDCARAPVSVSGLADATDLGLGDVTGCARRATGDVVCWGINGTDGALGDGVATHSSCSPAGDCARSPVTVASP